MPLPARALSRIFSPPSSPAPATRDAPITDVPLNLGSSLLTILPQKASASELHNLTTEKKLLIDDELLAFDFETPKTSALHALLNFTESR